MLADETIHAALWPLAFSRAELSEFREAASQPASSAIRLRAGTRPRSMDFTLDPVPWHPRGFWIAGGRRPAAHVAFAAGEYYVQDAGSLLPLSLLLPQPGERICDLCAAPGGKATAIVESLGGGGWLLANEPIRRRLAALQLNLARNGGTRYVVSGADPLTLAQALGPIFDAVLVDAPCSGQSLVGRGKQSPAAWQPRHIRHCAARQTRILDAAAALVRPGGRLVYSTCTFAVAENEQQLDSFLDRHPGWRVEPHAALARWESPLGPGSYRLWPHRDRCAGGFATRLRRVEAECGQVVEPASLRGRGRASKRDPPPKRPLRPGQLPPGFDAWGGLEPAWLLGSELVCYAWPEPVWEPLLAVCTGGPEVAFRKHSTWFPAYALAMRRDPGWCPRQRLDVSVSAAADYLAGLAIPGTLRGWAVVTIDGQPLGWAKGDGTRAKNHLPKPARLTIS